MKSVAVEQDSTSSKVCNIEMVREALVLKVLNRLLWRTSVPFARNVLQWHPSLPRRGPGFQLRILIRVCSTERLGASLSKWYFGWGGKSSFNGLAEDGFGHVLCSPNGATAL